MIFQKNFDPQWNTDVRNIVPRRVAMNYFTSVIMVFVKILSS